MTFTFFLLATLISCLTLHTDAAAISRRGVEKHEGSVEHGSIVPRSPDLHILQPMSIDLLYHALDRRDEVPHPMDYSRLDPSDQELMMFGTPLDDESYFVANLTLNAPPKTRILLMEKFEGLTSAVDCSTAGDNKLSVSFIDSDVFEYIQIWSWLNENDDNEFVMITNHDGCGPDSQRAVFWVRKVHYVEEDLRVDFYAVPAEWKEVTGTYAVDFGTLYLERKHEAGYLEKREPLDLKKPFRDAKKGLDKAGKQIKNGVDKAGQEAKNLAEKTINDAKKTLGPAFDHVAKVVSKAGSGKVGKDNISLDLTVGTPGQKKNIYTDILQPKNPRQIIDCLDCYVKGKIMMSGHLQIENFIPKSALLEAKPQDLSTTMKFGVTLKANKDKKKDGQTDALRFELPIFKMPLPGLSIPFIFELGPKAQLTIGFQSNIREDAEFTFGMKGSVPNNAVFRKDLLKKDTPATSNSWEGAKIESLPFELLGGTINMQFETTTNLVLGVGMRATGLFNYEAGFKLKLPRYAADLKTITNKPGQPACKDNANKSATGVIVKSDVNIELVAIAGNTMVIGQFVEVKLMGFKFPIPDKCHPIKDLRPPPAAPPATPPATPTQKPTAVVPVTQKPATTSAAIPATSAPVIAKPATPEPQAAPPKLADALPDPPQPQPDAPKPAGPLPVAPVAAEPSFQEPAILNTAAIGSEIEAPMLEEYDTEEAVVETPVASQSVQLLANDGARPLAGYMIAEEPEELILSKGKPKTTTSRQLPKRMKYRLLRA